MSKDNQPNNLRLLGSPVNLSYRCKKKDDKKNRNRPRSALQHSYLTPDIQEKHKRPFSADGKEHVPSTKAFLKTFNTELLQAYSSPFSNIKIVAPTTELLRGSKSHQINCYKKDKELCSNASDYGSEDTFVSLGTKIKARAQSPKAKNSNCKNFIKYRNVVRRNRKVMDNSEIKNNNAYDLDVKINERKDLKDNRNKNLFEERSSSPSFNAGYDCFYLPFDNPNKSREVSPSERMPYRSGPLHAEVEHAIDTYSRRLNLNKQQLSLVEEETTQDLDSGHSRHNSNPTPKNSLADEDNETDAVENKGDTYLIEDKRDYPKYNPDIAGPRTYNTFYEDFQNNAIPSYTLSSTVIPHDGSSKDSGYTDSGGTTISDDRIYRRGYSLPNKSSFTRKARPIYQPNSLESIPQTNSKDVQYIDTLKSDNTWVEPVNHSRLLYKDFFLKKEGHIALAPQNSPNKSHIDIPGSSQSFSDHKAEDDDDKCEYPSYLLNSNTKAYTSQVIEDYKKEIQAINNLHELTVKDIKTDAISPTPLNIDKMFEEALSSSEKSNGTSEENCADTAPHSNPPKPSKIPTTTSRNDICDVSTKELINKYLKVKGDFSSKDFFISNLKKSDKKVYNIAPKVVDNSDYKQSWNSKSHNKIVTNKSSYSSPIKTVNNNSSRINDVHNDKDVESWISMAAPSPEAVDDEQVRTPTPKQESKPNTPKHSTPRLTKIDDKNPDSVEISTNEERDDNDPAKTKDLNSDATVLDIYSMLKEIESYGELPVTEVAKVDSKTDPPTVEDKQKPSTDPSDNFMEIFQFLEKVEESANVALSGVTNNVPQSIPRLEALLKLPQTELAQRLVTALLQLEERSCCIALLQESLANHKEQMINKVSNLEKQCNRTVGRVKQDCEEAIKRHQNFIDQLINDKKTLNHRIEQLVDERRAIEEKWRRSAQTLEERYQLQLKNQHDKMIAQQQVARQRWVRQKAEKIKELTVKGLEGELREMAERQQKEIADLKTSHVEQMARCQTKHHTELDELRRELELEKETAIAKERQMANNRLEKQILDMEASYQEQRKRLVAELRAENERAALGLSEQESARQLQYEKQCQELEKSILEKKAQFQNEIAEERKKLEEERKQLRSEINAELDRYKAEYEAAQQVSLKAKIEEITIQNMKERDRAIEKAIETLDAEAQSGRKELQEALRRNKEQYELELREIEKTEKATLRRYQESQARVRETEDRCAQLEVTVNQLTARNRILTEQVQEADRRTEEARASAETKWREMVEELNRKMEENKKVHEEQMHQLYAKVKIAVARKDSAIQALNREAAKSQEKVTLLEQKLQQQRKDFLKHK